MNKKYFLSSSGSFLSIWLIILSIVLIFLLLGRKFMNDNNQNDLSDTYYFSSPSEAIEIITELLKGKNFKTLAKYYDLTNSEVKQSDLESGDFFYRKDRPEIFHPGGFWRYKHPFAPGFTFKSVRGTTKDNVYIVEISISIEQGVDSPNQTGSSYFYMMKSDKGWKILPDPVPEEELHNDVPTTLYNL